MGQHVLVMIGIIVLAALVVAAAVVAVARRGRPAARPAAVGHRPGHVRPTGTSGSPPAAGPVRRPAPEPTAVFADQIQVRVIVMDPHDPDWRPGYVHGVRVDGPRVTAIGNHIDDGSPWTMSVPANRPFVVHVPVTAPAPVPATQEVPRAAALAAVR